jgi:hypothetical protein
MRDRIGALHLDFRVPRGGSLAAAVPPSVERAVRAGLARALEERLAATFGDDGSVIVVRELASRVALGRPEWSLDVRAVDRICRSSLEAMASLLARSPPDEVARWPSETDFVGAFVLELLAGTAWDRWYFGAFRRLRRADPRETLEAVLRERGAEAPRLLAWLAARGRLQDVLALLDPAVARRLATGGEAKPEAAEEPEVAPLAAAAFRLAALLGVAPRGADPERACLGRFLATDSLPPDWSDRRSLSAWVLALVRFAAGERAASPEPRSEPDAAGVARALEGLLDWLDDPWLRPRLLELAAPAGTAREGGRATAREGLLTPRQASALERLALAVRDRRIPLDASRADEAWVRLLAAAAAEAVGGPDRSVAAAVERVLGAWRAILDADADRTRALDLVDAATPRHPRDASVAAQVERVHRAGPAAVALLRAAVAATRLPVAGEPTRGASLFLLARPMLDLRLDALAGARAVPLVPLLGALAAKWLGLEPPFDGPTALWAGAERPDPAALAAGDVSDLAGDVVQVLRDQRLVEGDVAAALAADVEAFPPYPAPAEVDRAVAVVAAAVIRAWARWLPGLRGASARYLREGSLVRGGSVVATRESVDVRLDPAPLDVVLEMAGYLRPIARVSWLDGRAVTFAVRRAARA